jgi:hypothetical protein
VRAAAHPFARGAPLFQVIVANYEDRETTMEAPENDEESYKCVLSASRCHKLPLRAWAGARDAPDCTLPTPLQ